MATTTGSLTYARNGKRERIALTQVPTLTALQQFAQIVYTFTTAGIVGVSFTTTDDPELPEKAGSLEDISFYCRVKLRQVNPPEGYQADMKLLDIPAPDFTYLTNIPGVGYRLTTAAGNAIATAYSNLTGEPWQFEDGKLCGSP